MSTRGTGSVARESRIGELELTVRRLELGTGIRGAAIGMTHVDMLGAHDAALGDVDGRVSRWATRTATLDTELRERVETLERLYGDLNEGLTLRVDRLNEWLERLAKDEGERLNELEKRVPFDEGGGLLERIGRIDDHLQSLDEGLGAADRARSSHRDGLESRLQALEERGVSWDGSAEQIELLVAGQMARCDAEGCRRWTLRPETEGWARIVNDGEAWLCPDHRTDGGSS